MRIYEIFENEEWEPPINPNLWQRLVQKLQTILDTSGFDPKKSFNFGAGFDPVPLDETKLREFFDSLPNTTQVKNILEASVSEWNQLPLYGVNLYIRKLMIYKLQSIYKLQNKDNTLSESKKKLRGSITFTPRLGADVDYGDFDQLPVVNLKVADIRLNEPYKMIDPQSKRKVRQLIKIIKQGITLSPILVRTHNQGHHVLDGHHRLKAYKLLGLETIPARIVPNTNIKMVWPKNRNL